MVVLVDFFVKRYLGKLADFAEGEICRVLGVEKEIEKLTKKLARIGPRLQDADRRRHVDDAINTWVTELKDIFYDAEDIIDDCMLQGGELLKLHSPSSSSSSSSSSVVSLLSSRFGIANRIEQLNERLKEFSEDSPIITKLDQYSHRKDTEDQNIAKSPETTPNEVRTDIVGTQIEEAAEVLIDRWILKDEGKKRCHVFGVVGMGGIGKTTLARKIYNDDSIAGNFPKRIWLHVSKDYSKTRLLKNIVEMAEGQVDDGVENIQKLEDKVISVLNGNFFIVLDDVWSIDVWNDLLRTPILKAANNNSGRILVTSRNEEVVRGMKACYTHHVKEMKEGDGWKLLCRIVFDEEEDSKAYGLDDIGMKIVKQCDGLPLAIKVTAGVLLLKQKTRGEWEKVLKSDLWQMNQIDAEIPKALYLSYEDLPSYLKECFLSCALYNGILDCRDIVRLWVAEGFIVEQGNTSMEEVAEDYYKQLLRRNLLQLDPVVNDNTFYIVHDLLRALGRKLIRGEGIIMTDDQIPNTNPLTKIRRLSLWTERDPLTVPSAILKENCLRVLIICSSIYESISQIKTIEDGLFERLTYLRILDIRRIQISKLPDSLFELLHLRYLNLSRTSIDEIPETIGRLSYLQTLDISRCNSLRRLPNGITKLLNLRLLDLHDTPLTHLPKGIGRLTNLNEVRRFVIGHDNHDSRSEGCDLEDLQFFSKIRILHITRLDRATTMGTSVLADKTEFLRDLRLHWMSYYDQNNRAPFTEEEIGRAEKICEELMPPSTIEDMEIHNFPGRRFPEWIMSSSAVTTLRCLTRLQLCNCTSFMELPPLGQLPQLKSLIISGAEAIKKIGREFLGWNPPAAPAAFPKLESLTFHDMPNWEEWWLCEGEECGDLTLLFPTLQWCRLVFCPKLRGIPENLYRATNLKTILVTGTDEYTWREFSRPASRLVLRDLLSGVYEFFGRSAPTGV